MRAQLLCAASMTMSQMGSTWTRRTRQAGWPLLPRLHGVLRRRRLRDQVVHLRRQWALYRLLVDLRCCRRLW